MAPQFVVTAGPDRGRAFPLRPGGPLLIGRGRQTDTCLTDPHVSRVHCQAELRGGLVVVTDLKSISGTLVNGRAVTEQALRPGDEVVVGETTLRFVTADPAEQPTVPPAVPGGHIPFAEVVGDAEVRATDLATPMPAVSGPPAATTRLRPKAASAPPPRPAPEPARNLHELGGTTLAHFQIGFVIARGQSGYVYRATDLEVNRPVALKVLRPELSRDPATVQRFIRSMKMMLPLRHPNLIPVLGAGKKGRFCWIAMEYVEGESLTQVLQRIGVAGMLDWRRAYRVALDLAQALAFAHDHGVIHRNLTPQNVLVRDSDRRTLLGDLMLAKAFEGGPEDNLTRPDELVGDVRFLSPERTAGTAGVDHRSDLYGLGALTYALLTGKSPCEGETLLETLTRIRTAAPVPPRQFQMAIPEAFQGVVLRLLAKRPEERFQSARELIEQLERVGKFQGVGG